MGPLGCTEKLPASADVSSTGAVLEGATFLFEMPTGIVADAFSRRLSIIIGTALFGAGPVCFGLFPSLGGIVLGQVAFGIGLMALLPFVDVLDAEDFRKANMLPFFFVAGNPLSHFERAVLELDEVLNNVRAVDKRIAA